MKSRIFFFYKSGYVDIISVSENIKTQIDGIFKTLKNGF
jgi:hypothetical protein